MNMLPAQLQNLHARPWYGLLVVSMLFFLFIIQFIATVGAWTKSEGMHGFKYYTAHGGPPGAGGALNDHTGASGDQSYHHVTGAHDEGFHQSEWPVRRNTKYADHHGWHDQDGFLGARDGPSFTENAAALAAARVAPLQHSVQGLRRDVDLLSQPPPPAEISLANWNGYLRNTSHNQNINAGLPVMTSNTAAVLASEGLLDDKHSEDGLHHKLRMGQS